MQIRTVTGACSSGQARNIALAGQLQEVQRSLLALLPRLPPPASDALACAAWLCWIQLCLAADSTRAHVQSTDQCQGRKHLDHERLSLASTKTCYDLQIRKSPPSMHHSNRLAVLERV